MSQDSAGFALLTVILVIAALTFLAMVGAKGAQRELRIADTHRSVKQALSAGEAGVNHGWGLLKATLAPGVPRIIQGIDPGQIQDIPSITVNNLTVFFADGGTAGLTAIGSAVALDGETYRFGAFAGNGADGYYVRVEDNHDESPGPNNPSMDTDNHMYVTARALIGRTERVVRGVVVGRPLFPVGFLGCDQLRLNGTSTTDSYDSRIAPYDPLNPNENGDVGSNGDVVLSGGAQVRGDATAGGTVGNPGSVTGESVDGAQPFDACSRLVAPCGGPYSPGAGITSGNYDPQTGDLSGGGSTNIRLANGTYCFHDVTLAGNSTLTVDGPVSIYLTGVGRFVGGGLVNTTSRAENLMIFSSGPEVKLTGGTNTYASVYAPSADVELVGGSQFYGAFVGQTVFRNGGGGLHYDESLGNIITDLRIAAQREVRNN